MSIASIWFDLYPYKDGSIIGNRICENQPLGTQCCSVKYALKCDQVVHRQCFWIAWSFGNVVLAFFSSVHLHKDTRSPNVLPGRMHVHTVPTELFSTIYNSTYTSALCTVSQKLCPIALKFHHAVIDHTPMMSFPILTQFSFYVLSGGFSWPSQCKLCCKSVKCKAFCNIQHTQQKAGNNDIIYTPMLISIPCYMYIHVSLQLHVFEGMTSEHSLA